MLGAHGFRGAEDRCQGFKGIWSVGIGGAVPAPHPLPLDQPRLPVPAGQAEQPSIISQESSSPVPGPAGRPSPCLPLV